MGSDKILLGLLLAGKTARRLLGWESKRNRRLFKTLELELLPVWVLFLPRNDRFEGVADSDDERAAGFQDGYTTCRDAG